MKNQARQGLGEIFQELKKILEEYAPPLSVREDGTKNYHLWSVKDLVIDGRKRKEVYFAGLIVQSSYVGFYFMPVYSDPGEFKDVFPPELASLLKGKSCFHIKKLDPSLKQQIKSALQAGFTLYKNRGWI